MKIMRKLKTQTSKSYEVSARLSTRNVSWRTGVALSVVQYIFNTTIHRDIGYSSAELLFGPANNLNQFVTDQRPITALENVAWWGQQLDIHSDILRKAEELQRETDVKRLEIRAGVPTTYAIDSYVIVE